MPFAEFVMQIRNQVVMGFSGKIGVPRYISDGSLFQSDEEILLTVRHQSQRAANEPVVDHTTRSGSCRWWKTMRTGFGCQCRHPLFEGGDGSDKLK